MCGRSRKAVGAQWKCRQPSGSGWKTAGRNWSEALGLRCRDKSGIGVIAATFLFRGCQRKKRVSGKKICQVQLPDRRELQEEKAEVTGSSTEDRKCREWHKRAAGE